jgi:hypothetical protein
MTPPVSLLADDPQCLMSEGGWVWRREGGMKEWMGGSPQYFNCVFVGDLMGSYYVLEVTVSSLRPL